MSSQGWWPRAYPTQEGPQTADDIKSIPPEKKEERPKLPPEIHAVKDANVAAPGGRTLIVCLDGTGDKFDSDNSNVVNLVSCLKKDHPNQVTYYQAGIGTYNKHGLSTGLSSAVDMAVGSSLGTHVKDAYRFLMQTYREGDRICLFGFSRGAYTVRCLAGMLHKVGLLPPHNVQQVQFAYEIYKDNTDHGWDMSVDFKRTFCMNVNVYFVGVWDCVVSVGFIPRYLPLSSTSTSWVQHFRHAMSLDERRAKFKICRWQQDELDAIDKQQREEEKLKKKGKDKPKKKKECRVDQHHVPNDVLEVWFAGCHADVGGGSERNHVRHSLARIPLRWMIRQCFECNTGIIFDSAALAETGLDVHNVWPVYKKPTRPLIGPSPELIERYFSGQLQPLHRRSTALGLGSKEEAEELNVADLLPEEAEDYFDARANVNDQLNEARGWWILEFIPIKLLKEIAPGRWHRFIGFNTGRHRVVREEHPQMHWTVETRMNEMRYRVKNTLGSYANWSVTA
jgi:uncharacterized protein (DUF2235 family)